MTKTIDFDAFRAEQTKEPVILRLGGRDYDLPTGLPAALALDIARLHEMVGDDMEVSPAELEKMGGALFGGAAKFHEILSEGGITMDEMPELLQKVLELYTGPGPNRAARRQRAKPTPSRSSRTGSTSSRTS